MDNTILTVTDLFPESYNNQAASSSGDQLTNFGKLPPSLAPTNIPEPPRIPQTDVKLMLAHLYGKPPEAEVSDIDILTTVEFNNNGEFLAVGDRGGRVTIYKRELDKLYRGAHYPPYLEFQSHEPEFDYLKSIEIEERIVQLKWVPRDTYAKFLLSSNDKTVKLWKVGERCGSSTENLNLGGGNCNNLTKLALPKVVHTNAEPNAMLRRCYSNAHSYHINTISVNCDQETFISSDDLRINLWNLEVTDQSFVIVDVKPELMEALQEVITTCTFHPSRCNLFAYSTSKGMTKLCDMRVSALCDRHAKLFHEDPINRNYYSEIVNSIGDSQFSNSGRYLATRDYLNLKIWDTLMESKPVHTIPVHGYLKEHLFALYDNDSIFDKFNVSWSGNDTKLATGSYGHLFNVTERSPCKSSLLEIPKDSSSGTTKVSVLKPKRIIDLPPPPGLHVNNSNNKVKKSENDILVTDIDCSRRVVSCQWSPGENVLALACHNNLYFFQEKRGVYT